MGFRAGLLTQQLAGGLISPRKASPQGYLSVLPIWWLTSPEQVTPESKAEPQCSLTLLQRSYIVTSTVTTVSHTVMIQGWRGSKGRECQEAGALGAAIGGGCCEEWKHMISSAI